MTLKLIVRYLLSAGVITRIGEAVRRNDRAGALGGGAVLTVAMFVLLRMAATRFGLVLRAPLTS